MPTARGFGESEALRTARANHRDRRIPIKGMPYAPSSGSTAQNAQVQLA